MKSMKKYALNFFEKKFRTEKNSKVKMRIQILMHLREGYVQREVSKMLRISVGIVPYWKARFEEFGIEGLSDKKGRGVKQKISDEQISMLRSALEEPFPTDDGYSRGWNRKDVSIFILEQFGLNFTRQHVCKILHWIGCSMQVPRPRNKSRNQKDVNKFKRQLKKNEKIWAPK
jgi:transposase